MLSWPATPAASDAAATAGPDLADLEALYDTHHRQALGLAYHVLGNLRDAEDVVQEVFLAAWRAAHTYDPTRGPVRAWLLRMVRNRSIDVLRVRQRRPTRPLDPALDPPDESDVPAQASVNVDGQTARQALDGLPPEQREVIELAYFRGLSHSEIASLTGAPVGTVKGRIRLAMDRLRGALGVGREAAAAAPPR